MTNYASSKDNISTLKDIYNPNFPCPHEHSYTKTITQDIFEEVYQNKQDEEYARKCPDRWQGKLRKIGENKFQVCTICDRTEGDIERLNDLMESFPSDK